MKTQAFKYKDKSYYADLDNIVDLSEYNTLEVKKFNEITFDMFVDITSNPIKKLLINGLIIMRGIKFDIAVKVKFYKWQQVTNELINKLKFTSKATNVFCGLYYQHYIHKSLIHTDYLHVKSMKMN